MNLAPLVLWFRRSRVDALPLAVLVVTVLLTAALAAAAPLLAVRASRDALTEQLARAGTAERSVVVTTGEIFQLEVPDDLQGVAARFGAAIDGAIPERVRGVLDDPSLALESEPW